MFMRSKENGVILQEVIIVKNPSKDESISILTAQSEHPDLLIIAEWFDETGLALSSATIPSRQSRTPNEIRKLSEVITGANRLSVQEVLRF